MQFAIMVWTSQSVARANAIFGVIDHKRPAQLSQLANGHWENFRVPIDEGRFKLAQDAKKAIEGNGYYLFGARLRKRLKGGDAHAAQQAASPTEAAYPHKLVPMK